MFSNDQININNKTLIRQCSEVRTKMFIKVYTLSIYYETKYDCVDDIFMDNNQFLIELKFLMDISNDKIKQSMFDGLANNCSEIELNMFQNDINKFLSIFDNINITQYDILCIHYNGSEINIRLTYKNEFNNVTINNTNFKNLLLKIWLGTKPVDKHLKNILIKCLT